jgi:hypothetical protein
MDVPADPPAACPVCERPYDSVSRHADGLLVNLRDNDRYRRVCAAPVADGDDPAIDFFHHTHAQAGTGAGDSVGAATVSNPDPDPDRDPDPDSTTGGMVD